MAVNFKDESEVKEYLDNIGIEYRFGCYSEKKPEVCHLLADYLEAIHRDFEKARRVFKSTCDDYGYAKSCFKYANYTHIGRGKAGSKPNPTEALQYYEKGCGLGDPDNCLHAGLMLASKKMGNARDLKRGVEYLTKSCEMDNGNACFYLSSIMLSGAEAPEAPKPKEDKPFLSSTNKAKAVTKPNDFVVPPDMEKAFKFTYKACELKNIYACANLSNMYARGDGTEKNPEKAEIFKRKALELQNEGKDNKPLLFSQAS